MFYGFNTIVQRPVPTFMPGEETSMSTLQYVLRIILDSTAHRIKKLADESAVYFDKRFAGIFEAQAVVHGLTFPMHTPLLELWAQYCHADMFLYVVIVDKKYITRELLTSSCSHG